MVKYMYMILHKLVQQLIGVFNRTNRALRCVGLRIRRFLRNCR